MVIVYMTPSWHSREESPLNYKAMGPCCGGETSSLAALPPSPLPHSPSLCRGGVCPQEAPRFSETSTPMQAPS